MHNTNRRAGQFREGRHQVFLGGEVSSFFAGEASSFAEGKHLISDHFWRSSRHFSGKILSGCNLAHAAIWRISGDVARTLAALDPTPAEAPLGDQTRFVAAGEHVSKAVKRSLAALHSALDKVALAAKAPMGDQQCCVGAFWHTPRAVDRSLAALDSTPSETPSAALTAVWLQPGALLAVSHAHVRRSIRQLLRLQLELETAVWLQPGALLDMSHARLRSIRHLPKLHRELKNVL